MSRADNLPELLAEHGIQPKSFAPGRDERLVCPRCGGGRSKERSLALTIDADGLGAVWVCHRGHCGWRDGVTLRRSGEQGWTRPAPAQAAPAYQAPTPAAAAEQHRPERLYTWFQDRGISAETVDSFGCYETTKAFRGPDDTWVDKPAIVFPYRFEGRLVNRKYRSPQKELMQDKAPLPTLFNVDAVEGDEQLIWVEGEPDVMAVHEAGYLQVVSLKDGASKALRAEDDPRRQDDKRFAALATHAERLGRVKRHLLAGDMDEPGLALREEIARRMGRHLCWIVRWPEGCKDAGDVLRLHGADALCACIEAAEPYPMEGLQRIKPGDLMALRNQGVPETLTTGATATDAILSLPGEGRLIVITGIPNHGKSTWALYVKAHVMRNHRRRFVVFSPEMEPWREFVAQMAAVLWRKPFRPCPGYESMTDDELSQAETYLRDRLIMLVADPDKEDQAPTLDWILERARLEVMRAGVTDLFIDPWNELEHRRPEGASETDYIGRCLQRLRAFSRRHGCNVWIVAHPTKLHPEKLGKPVPPPTLYNISGSANWANKADLGITVHTVNGQTQIHLTKARFRRWGRRDAVAHLQLDIPTGVFSNAPVPLPGEDG